MSNQHNNSCEENGSSILGRRKFLMAGVGVIVAPVLTGLVDNAQAKQTEALVGKGAFSARAYGATSATSPLRPLEIQRRAIGPRDVLLDVLYCGVCHSDIHIARSEWGPSSYPCVPGHEIIGRVQAMGSAVSKFKVGDIGGVGCMVDACGACENCLADREQNCLNGTAFTYDSTDRVTGGNTYGGYSDKMVVTERFVIRIPQGTDLPATAPLLCAGVTAFSPMQHWKLAAGQRVGVIGLGGLGHIAVKLAAARKAEVTVFTVSSRASFPRSSPTSRSTPAGRMACQRSRSRKMFSASAGLERISSRRPRGNYFPSTRLPRLSARPVSSRISARWPRASCSTPETCFSVTSGYVRPWRLGTGAWSLSAHSLPRARSRKSPITSTERWITA